MKDTVRNLGQMRKKINSIFFYDVKSFIGCLAHELHDPSREQYVLSCREALPPSSFSYDFCNEGLPDNHPKAAAFFPVYFYELTNCRQSIDTGVVFLDQKELIAEEFSWGWGKTRTNSSPSWRIKRTREIFFEEPVFICAGRGYHGIVDDLTHVAFFYDWLEEATIILSESNNYLHGLIVELFPELKIATVPDGMLIYAKHLLATTKTPLAEFVQPQLLSALQRVASERMPVKRVNSKNIYISRKNTAKRCWPDENFLENLMYNEGFSVIKFEELKIFEQLDVMLNAEIVVGRHGAGLANICFSKKNLQIIEIFDRAHFNACYSSMAAALNHKYFAVPMHSKNDDPGHVFERVMSCLR